MKRWWKPGILLAILSPVLAELVSGSTPPLAFFFPVTLPFFIFYYGVGVLIVRELSHRWSLPWPGLLLLGAAFGVTAEAFIAGTWVDITSEAADIRWGTLAGLNWGIVFPFCLYHAVYSVGIPVFAVNRLFPQRVSTSWVRPGRWNKIAVGVWMVFTGAFMIERFDPLPTTVAFVAMTVLVVFARMSTRWTHLTALYVRTDVSNRRLFLAAFACAFVTFAIGWWTRPGFPGAAVLTNLVVLVAPLALAFWSLRLPNPDDDERPEKPVALIGGAVAYLTLQGAIGELIGALGMSLVAIGMIIFMVRFWRRERSKPSTSNPANHNQRSLPSPV